MVRCAVKPHEHSIASGAAGFVNRAGIALFPEDEVTLPGLREAAVGNWELTVFKTNQEGRRADARHTPRVVDLGGAQRRLHDDLVAWGGIPRGRSLPADESESTTGGGMTIERSRRSVAPRRMETIARQLLDASKLCAIATVSPRELAHINTAYFAWGDDLNCVWLSHPAAAHSRNLRANPSVAVAVYDSNQAWGDPDRGIQLFGMAREVSGRAELEAKAVYAKRFSAYAKHDLSAYRFYRFRPRRMKLFDEAILGAGVFVMASIRGGKQIVWERTERYPGD